MVKRLLFTIGFVLITVLFLDFSIGKILRYFYFRQVAGEDYRTTYSMEETKADVLVFGSSRAVYHYVPEVFEDSLNLSFYNTGRGGQFIFYQTAVLKSVLKRYTPKLVILDFMGSFEKGEDYYDRMSCLLPYYANHPEIRDLVELRSPFEKIKLVSGIYPFNSQFLNIAVGNLEINKKRKPDNKGYVAFHNELTEDIDSLETKSIYEIDSNKVVVFKEFLLKTRSAGIPIIVIFSPVYYLYDQDYSVSICRDICRQEKVPFYDFSKDPIFLNKKKLFADNLHVNHKGAILLSQIVINKIKQSKCAKYPDYDLIVRNNVSKK
ncbi:hypothetical protein AYK24_03370 [Thermoplasmatales archaeon SG8-52-4]|nr:MAG: hypothetical protein AYK24_03370 [Thermoplasmatales archaeon SG8-52-4]